MARQLLRDPSLTPVLAAGALVRRVVDDRLELLLVHRPRYDDWSFAKGKLDLGEHVLTAAVREVREETGLTVALRFPLPSQHYEAEGRPKQVRYWLADVVSGEFTPNNEVDEVAWLGVDEARERLSWERDRLLIDAATSAPDTTAIAVVRHAKALPRSAWSGDDAERPLSETGQRQAERLVGVLAAYAPAVILTSDTERTVATVAPFALSVNLPLDSEPLFSESGFDSSRDATRVRAGELRAVPEPIVVCSHRPVLRTIVDELLAGSDVPVPAEQLEVAGMWVLHLHAGRAVALERHDA